MLINRIMSPNHKFSLMTLVEKFLLEKIATQLPDNAIVVEIGTYLGGSTSVIACANPNIFVHSYDLYDDFDYDKFNGTNYQELALGKNSKRTLDNVKKVVDRYTNITLHKVLSDSQLEWNQGPIDFVFHDGNHTNPTLQKDLDFWSQYLKPNGLIAIHDHRPNLPESHFNRWLDVEKEVSRLTSEKSFKIINGIDSLVVMQKVL